MADSCQFLTIDDIVFINRRMCETTGGLYIEADQNFANRSSLEYILDAVAEPIFGRHLYPTIPQKAAAIGYRIMTSHVFHEGNKRTGLEACRLFLDINGLTLKLDYDDAVSATLAVATDQLSEEAFSEWVASRIVAA